MVLTKGITLWSTKIFLQNLRYRHKQNIEIPKLAYMIYFFSVISQKAYTAHILPIREVSIALV